MARPLKTGLDYFPLDVDFFNDDKLQFIAARFEERGELITVKLLCKIYKNGYYLHWDEDQALLFAKGVGSNCSHALVKDVVFELVKRGFFDRSMFDSFSVLTSYGIQKRYLKICHDAKRKIDLRVMKFSLFSFPPELNEFTPEETGLSPEFSTQRKEKESKVNNYSLPAREVGNGIFDLSNSNLFRQPSIPTKEKVIETFCVKNGTEEMAEKFFEKMQAVGWFYKGSPVTDFTNLVPGFIENWIKNEKSKVYGPKRNNTVRTNGSHSQQIPVRPPGAFKKPRTY